MKSLSQFINEGKGTSTGYSVKGTFIFDQVDGDGVNDSNVNITIVVNKTGTGKVKSIGVSLTSSKYASFRGLGQSISTEVKGKANIQGFLKNGRVMALGIPNNERNRKAGTVGTYYLIVNKADLAKISSEISV